MALVAMNSMVVGRVPTQAVYVGSDFDSSVFCTDIDINDDGTTAVIDAPRLLLSSNKTPYYLNEVAVFADQIGEGFGSPMFIGAIDTGRSILRNGKVMFRASSIYSHLRRRSIALRETLTSSDGGTRTFAATGRVEFTETNTHLVGKRVFTNWTPGQILSHFYNHVLDPWFKSRISFVIDPLADQLPPFDVIVYRWVIDGSGNPALEATVTTKSAMGDQVFRLNSWGQLIDFVAQMMPGVQTYEFFTATGTIVWLAQPFRNGSVQATLGKDNLDWRTVAADVEDLELETDNGGTINRFVGIGESAKFTITIMSETIDANGNLTGLVPAWDLYDLTQPDAAGPVQLHGASGFDYDTGFYSEVSLLPQKTTQLLNKPSIGDEKSPEYVASFEHVGRRWRLPNWFSNKDVVHGDDMFSDPKTGQAVNIQVFVEEAMRQSDGSYKYSWLPYGGEVDFDWKNRTFTLERASITWFLLENLDTAVIERDYVTGYKLSRVALTFTYSDQAYTPYADTYLATSGVIDPAKMTAIGPGQPLVFERPDLSYGQITNINMPMIYGWGERVAASREEAAAFGSIYQYPLETLAMVTYNDFIVAAFADGKKAMSIGAPSGSRTEARNAPYVVSRVLRDDTARLHAVIWQEFMWRGKRARKFRIALGAMVKAVRRGMLVGLRNLSNYENDFDAIDKVSHDLVSGQTVFTTTNQPGRSLDILTISQDRDV